MENNKTITVDEDYKRAGQSSSNEIRETIGQIKTACSREISILRTIYEMENKKAECADIVVKAREMLQEYDRS